MFVIVRQLNDELKERDGPPEIFGTCLFTVYRRVDAFRPGQSPEQGHGCGHALSVPRQRRAFCGLSLESRLCFGE